MFFWSKVAEQDAFNYLVSIAECRPYLGHLLRDAVGSVTLKYRSDVRSFTEAGLTGSCSLLLAPNTEKPADEISDDTDDGTTVEEVGIDTDRRSSLESSESASSVVVIDRNDRPLTAASRSTPTSSSVSSSSSSNRPVVVCLDEDDEEEEPARKKIKPISAASTSGFSNRDVVDLTL